MRWDACAQGGRVARGLAQRICRKHGLARPTRASMDDTADLIHGLHHGAGAALVVREEQMHALLEINFEI